jgi:hypothetical protein
MNLERRVFTLDNDDKTNVATSIKKFYSILDLSQVAGKGDNTTPQRTVDKIEYNLSQSSIVSSSDNLSAKITVNPVDDNFDGDRFFPITEIISEIIDQSVILYYDKKYNDFLYMPLFDKVVGRDYMVDGYCVRATLNGITSPAVYTQPLPTLKNNTGSDETRDTYIIDSKTHILFERYLNIGTNRDSIGCMLSSENYVETGKAEVNHYVSLGNSDDLFESDPRVCAVLTSMFNQPTYVTKRASIDDVLLPLPF